MPLTWNTKVRNFIEQRFEVKMEKEESGFGFTNVKNQLYATVIANWIVLSYGCIVGWLSPALPILLSDSTPLETGVITSEEMAWITCMSSVGAVFGTFLFGLISSKMGCKRANAYLAFPAITYWLLVHFGNSVYYLILARFIAGLTVGGMQSGVALYVSEISNDNVRGRLGSITPLARNVGVLIGFIGGSFVEYKYRPYIFVFFPIMFFFWLYSLPNTPQYYLNKENYAKAELALMYYKGSNGINAKEKMLLSAEFDRLKLVAEERKLNKRFQLRDLCNRMALKGIAVSFAMAWFVQMTGSFVIINFASVIFNKTGTMLDSRIASIILAAVQIIAGLVSTQFGDTFGRKTTMYISLSGTTVGLFALSAFSYLRQSGYDVSQYLWLPLVCLSLIIFISNAGIIALAHICAIENFPSKVRTTGVVLYSLCVSFVAFSADRFFPILLDTIHLHGCLLFFAINCCCGLIFVAFMKETKGKSLDSIETTKNKITSHKDSIESKI